MSQEVAQAVLKALDAEDANVLRAGCLMAGLTGLAEAERALIKALSHKVWQVKAEAARALGLLGSKGAVPFLRRLLKASDGELRQKMLAAAASREKAPAEGSDDEHPEVLRQAAIALNRINPNATQDALLAALASDQASLLSAAMAGLANLESEAGRERMVELLGHSDPGLRRAAAACLGRLRESSAVGKLVELLGDGDAGVRKEALIALNHIKDVRALGQMGDAMEDKDPEVRRVAAIALGNTRMDKPELVDPLVAGLRDRQAEVRKACLSALANMKAGEALEAAAALLADTSEDVARQAAITVTVLEQARERPEYKAG